MKLQFFYLDPVTRKKVVAPYNIIGQFRIERGSAFPGLTEGDYKLSEGTFEREKDGNTNHVYFKVRLTKGQDQVEYKILAVDDTVDEPREVIRSLLRKSYREDNNAVISVSPGSFGDRWIIDNDPTVVTLSAPAGDISEDSGTKVITIKLGRALVIPESLDVPLKFTGAATPDTDYTLACATATGVACTGLDSGSVTVTFTGGAASSRMATITLTASPDSIVESGENVMVRLGTLDKDSGTGLDGGATGSGSVDFSILDSGGVTQPVITITADASPVVEGMAANYTLTATPTPTESLAVSVSVADAAGADFVASNNEGTGTVMIPTAGTVGYAVATVNDSIDEPDGPVTVTVTPGTGYIVGDPGLAQITVTDDDDRGVGVSPQQLGLVEGGSAGSYAVVLQSRPTADVTVTATSPDPGAVQLHTGSGTPGDRVVLTFTASGAGLWSTPQTVTVTPVGDADAEDERVVITHAVSETGGYAGVVAASVTATVDDDDGNVPEVNLTVKPKGEYTTGAVDHINVIEGAEVEITVIVRPRPANVDSLEVSLNVQEMDESDFLESVDEGIRKHIINGDDDGNVSFDLQTVDDAIDEPDGMVRVTVEEAEGYTIGKGGRVTVSIRDNDPSLVQFATSASTTNEADGTVNVMVKIDPALPSDITLSYMADGTATSGQDYEQLSGSLDIKANSDSANIPVMILDDNTAEDEETIILTLTDGTGYDLGTRQVHTITITDANTDTDIDTSDPRILADRIVRPMLTRFGRTVAEQALDTAFARTGKEQDTGGISEFMTGSTFALMEGLDSDVSKVMWGRAAAAGFDGLHSGVMSINGDVESLILGMDWERKPWMVGLMMSQNRGDIGYRLSSNSGTHGEFTAGDIETDLAVLAPYGRLVLNDGLHLWGMAGQGWGKMKLMPQDGGILQSDIDWHMASIGLDGVIMEPRMPDSPRIDMIGDILWMRITSDAVSQRLAATSGKTVRLRGGLEWFWEHQLSLGRYLRRQAWLAVRRDSGDAERDWGLDIGGELNWSDPGAGLKISAEGRTLIMHGDNDFRDWGLALPIVYDPAEETDLGFSAWLKLGFGGNRPHTAVALDSMAFPMLRGIGENKSWELGVAYGLPRRYGLVGSPYAVLGGSDIPTDGMVLLGYRLSPDTGWAPDLIFDFWTRFSYGSGTGIGITLQFRW